MNEIDRSNVEFFLTASDDQLQEWFETATPADVRYALSILAVAQAEVVDVAVNRLDALPQAAEVIDRIRSSP